MFDALSIPRTTGYRIVKSIANKRLAIRQGLVLSDWKMIQSRHGFWQKVDQATRLVIDKWIRNHPHVIFSPQKDDTVEVRDPFTGNVVRKTKLLLQIPVRELYQDLYNPGTGHDDLVRDSDGKHLVSDTMFCALLPPEMRMLSNTYKQGCCCKMCTLFGYFQSA